MGVGGVTQSAIVNTIKQVLAEQVRPKIQQDGGDIAFVDFDQKGVVHVQLLGACIGCPIAIYTLKLGVLETLQEHIPQVTDVVAVEEE